MDQTVPAIVVMGVAGCGKSSVAAAVAARLNGRFIEGDTFHSPASVEKMRRGIGLVDADRWSWLDRLAAEMRQACARGEPVVLACSALKRRYRDRLRLHLPRSSAGGSRKARRPTQRALHARFARGEPICGSRGAYRRGADPESGRNASAGCDRRSSARLAYASLAAWRVSAD